MSPVNKAINNDHLATANQRLSARTLLLTSSHLSKKRDYRDLHVILHFDFFFLTATENCSGANLYRKKFFFIIKVSFERTGYMSVIRKVFEDVTLPADFLLTILYTIILPTTESQKTRNTLLLWQFQNSNVHRQTMFSKNDELRKYTARCEIHIVCVNSSSEFTEFPFNTI